MSSKRKSPPTKLQEGGGGGLASSGAAVDDDVMPAPPSLCGGGSDGGGCLSDELDDSSSGGEAGVGVGAFYESSSGAGSDVEAGGVSDSTAPSKKKQRLTECASPFNNGGNAAVKPRTMDDVLKRLTSKMHIREDKRPTPAGTPTGRPARYGRLYYYRIQ